MNNRNNKNLNPNFKFNKTKNDNSKSVFLKTFSFTLILMALLLYFFTPNIDVQIGDISQDNEFEEEIDYVNKKNVDYRLRWIQLEDNNNQFQDDLKKNEENEINESKSANEEDISSSEFSINENSAHNDNSLPMEPNEVASQIEESKSDKTLNEIYLPQDGEQKTSQPKSTFSKVYIGSYSDINSAIEVQNKLIETNLPVSPFIKKVNTNYVIQVGSFASLNKARVLVEQLAQQGFEARIVEE